MSKSAAKQQIVEQTIAELGSQLWEDFWESVEAQQALAPEQQTKLMEYLGGSIEKRDELARFIWRWEAEALTLRAEEKRLAQRRHAIDGFIRGLREFIALQMESWSLDGKPVTLKRIIGKISRFILKEGHTRLEMEDERAVPDEFCTYTRTVDKAAVAVALSAGRSVPGARLVPGRSFVEIR